MANKKAVSRFLLAAGCLCMAVAVWPYYSKTTETGVQVAGKRSKDTTRTIFRLGLAFSPLLIHESRIDNFEERMPMKVERKDVETPPGTGLVVQGHAEVTSFSFTRNVYSRLNITSWSMALVFVGLLLLTARSRLVKAAATA